MTLEELNVVITAQSEQFNKQMNQVKKQMTGFQNQSSSVSKTLSSMFNLQVLTVGIRLLKSAYSQITRMTAGYFDKIEQETKLAEVMRQRMNATNSQINAIKKLTEQEQSLGVVEDDVLMAGLQQLGTFAKYPETLSSLNGAMANLIAQQKGYDATAQDAITIGNLMGKVLQGQTSALTRVGITFTEAQEEVLKYGTEQEKAAMLAQVITDNVGNMNKALLNTPRGQLKQLQISLDDIGDSLSMGILSPLMAAMPTINMVVGKLQTAAKYFAATMQGLFGKLNNDPINETVKANEDLADSIESVNEAYQEGTSSIDEFNVASGFDEETPNVEIPDITGPIEDEVGDLKDPIAEAVKPLVDFIKGNKDSILSMIKAIGFVVSPLTRIATIVGIVIEQLKSNPELWQRFTNIFQQISDFAPTIMEFLASIGESLSSIILVLLENVANWIEIMMPSILVLLENVMLVIQSLIQPITDIITLVTPVFNIIAQGLATIIDGLNQIGLLQPLIMTVVAALIAWKIATLAQTAANWLLNASLAAKIGLMTFGAGLAIVATVGAVAASIASQADQIPAYANGGYDIDQGQLFVARERGPEMVGTIDGKTSVANNSQIVESVSLGVERAVSRALAGNNGQQSVTVKIDFNSNEAARILKPKLQYETNRTGGR